MIPEPVFLWAILATAIALAALLAGRRHRRHRELAAEGSSVVAGYETRDDQTFAFFHDAAEEVRHDTDRYDRRTLAELASECPACGGDHAGLCAALEQLQKDMEDDGILTGTIVAVEDIPAAEPETTTMVLTPEQIARSFVWETEHEWHQDTAGNWQAPWALLDSLPEDDWLRDVLTGTRELVAA